MQDLLVVESSTQMGLEPPQAAAVAAQARALVELRYRSAFARPRDIDAVRVRLLKECSRRGFAEKARYHKPVGEGLEGPSIRFVEAALRQYGNVEQLAFAIHDDERQRILRCTITDLEANVSYQRDIILDKTVERQNPSGRRVYGERQNHQGKTVYIVSATDEELVNKAGAIVSKTIRTLDLRILPPAIVEECMTRVIEVQAQGDAKDPDDAKKRLTDAYAQIGVTPSDLRVYLGHDLAKTTPHELAQLRAIWASIRDGQTTWNDEVAFKAGPMTPPAKPTQASPVEGPSSVEPSAGGAVIKRATQGPPPTPQPELDANAREVDHIVARMYADPEHCDDELANIAKLSREKRKGDDWSDYDWAKMRWEEITASKERKP